MNRKELFYISITIFLTIVAWILLEAYKVETSIKTEKLNFSKVEKKVTIDTTVLKVLKDKQTP